MAGSRGSVPSTVIEIQGRKRLIRARSAIVVGILGCLLLPLCGTGTSIASEVGTPPVNTKARPSLLHCDVEIDRRGVVLAKECYRADKPHPSKPSEMMGATELATFYADAAFGGQSTTVTGKSGTCDASGYALPDIAHVLPLPFTVSSIVLHGACQVSGWWYGWGPSSYSGTYSGRKTGRVFSSLGATWNDRIGSMKLYST